MKFTKPVFILCCLFCLYISPAQAATEHTVKGVVITTDGTVVPEFSVVVRHVSDKPELLQRKRFNNGEFTIQGLRADKYQVLISSPLFVAARLDLDFKSEPKPTDYSIVILHPYRNEARFAPGAAQTVSVKLLQQKIPNLARDAYRKGVDLHREGKLDDALVEYGKALRAYPEYLEALSDLGTIFLLYNRPESALTFLRRAQNVDECNPIVNLNIAIALIEQRQYGASLKLLKNVLRTEPRMAVAQYYIARIHHQDKKYDLAEADIRQAIETDPGFLDAWLLLVDVSLERKKYDEARDALQHIREAMNNRKVTSFIDEQLLTLGN